MDAFKDENGYDSCKYINVHDNYPIIFNRIDSALYSFLPFLIMIIANSAIIAKFMSVKYHVYRNKNSSSGGGGAANQALSKSATRGTLMLITVSFAFVALTAPVSIIYAIETDPDPKLVAITTMLDYFNHSINALLYMISGSTYRKEVKRLLNRCCRCFREKIVPITETLVTDGGQSQEHRCEACGIKSKVEF